jgi:hypothetical protein
MILDIIRISIKDDTTTRISKLSSRKQIHGKTRNKRKIRDRKEGSRKGAMTNNRKISTISSKDIKRKLKRVKRGQYIRVRGHMERSSRVLEPRKMYLTGGRSVRKTSVTQPTVPVEEEPEARSMSLSITISSAVREGLEGEAWVLVEGV